MKETSHIAELLTQNARLQEENQKLQELNAQKDKFFSMLAHDLRNPFTSLLAFTRFATEHLKEFGLEELQEIVYDMRNVAEHFYELLENLLIWSKLQQNMIVLRPKQLDVRKVAEETISTYRLIAEKKQITMTNALTPNTLMFADELMLDTILRNLVSNALKFTHAGGEVVISATSEERQLAISVADTGIGISPEDIPKLFRIDLRYKTIGTDEEEGTGLGMLICKELIERNGGSIQVESQIGKGTIITFRLPTEPLI